jgi:hypothetical protein
MMDDVVGLVMVQVISNLGSSAASFSAITVVRPILVSIGFAVTCPLICYFAVFPFTIWINHYRAANSSGWIQRFLSRHDSVFVIHTMILMVMITGSSYAGTSNLFAAYLAGAMVSWWDTEVPHSLGLEKISTSQKAVTAGNSEHLKSSSFCAQRNSDQTSLQIMEDTTSGAIIYRDYYSKAVDRILKPFFFVRTL